MCWIAYGFIALCLLCSVVSLCACHISAQANRSLEEQIMPKAHEIATELRKLADALDKQPELETAPVWVAFHCDKKEHFINAVRFLPRPFTKRETDHSGDKYNRLRFEYSSPAMDVNASIYKSLTCELVEPAKPAVFRCDPILSALEEASLEAANG
jgi:hypothetical protein